MTVPRPPKKSETLEVRMPHDQKRAFLEACRNEGRTASEVVRGFVEGYLARAAAAERGGERLLDEPRSWRSLAMSLVSRNGRRSLLAGGVGALGLLALAVSPSAADIDFRAMFDRMDANADGRVTVEEFARPPEPGRGGDTMVFIGTRTVYEGDGAAPPAEDAQMFWLPAPPPGADGAQPQRIERQLRVERSVDGGEVVTETIEPLDPSVFTEFRHREFSLFDGNADGAVDFAEFESRHLAMLENTFRQLDADADQRLSAAELAAFPAPLLTLPADAPSPLPSPYDAEAFAALDLDGDGGVTIEEFAAGPQR